MISVILESVSELLEAKGVARDIQVEVLEPIEINNYAEYSWDRFMDEILNREMVRRGKAPREKDVRIMVTLPPGRYGLMRRTIGKMLYLYGKRDKKGSLPSVGPMFNNNLLVLKNRPDQGLSMDRWHDLVHEGKVRLLQDETIYSKGGRERRAGKFPVPKSVQQVESTEEPGAENEGPLTDEAMDKIASSVVDAWKTNGLQKLLDALEGDKSARMVDKKRSFAYNWDSVVHMGRISTCTTSSKKPGLALTGKNNEPYEKVKQNKGAGWPPFSVGIVVEIPQYYTYERMADYVEHGLGKDVKALLEKYRQGKTISPADASFNKYLLHSTYERSDPGVDAAKAEIRNLLKKAGAPEPRDIDVELEDGRAYAYVARKTVMFVKGKRGWELADPKLFASWFPKSANAKVDEDA